MPGDWRYRWLTFASTIVRPDDENIALSIPFHAKPELLPPEFFCMSPERVAN
jgi:hypothetical protein